MEWQYNFKYHLWFLVDGDRNRAIVSFVTPNCYHYCVYVCSEDPGVEDEDGAASSLEAAKDIAYQRAMELFTQAELHDKDVSISRHGL